MKNKPYFRVVTLGGKNWCWWEAGNALMQGFKTASESRKDATIHMAAVLRDVAARLDATGAGMTAGTLYAVALDIESDKLVVPVREAK